MAKLIMDKFAW